MKSKEENQNVKFKADETNVATDENEYKVSDAEYGSEFSNYSKTKGNTSGPDFEGGRNSQEYEYYDEEEPQELNGVDDEEYGSYYEEE